MTALGCDEFRELAPEVALGLLGGGERSAAVDHLATCSSCRAHLDELMRVADLLLLLTPAVEPEVGFESRVVARLAVEGAFAPAAASPRGVSAPGTRSRRPHWARRAVIAGIAAAVVALAAIGGLAAGRRTERDRAARTQAAAVNNLAVRAVVVRADGGRSLCQVVAFPRIGSQAARLVVHLDEPGDPGSSYQVLVEPTGGGPAVPIGTIAMAGEQGSLMAAIPAGTGPVDAVRILDGADTVRYRATFPAI